MILAWDNRFDAATLTPGSAASTMPVGNVQHPHLSRRWHTASGVKSSYVLADLGAATACAVLAVVGTNLTSAATFRLRASTADPTAVAGDLLDTGVVAGAVKTGYGAIYKGFAAVTARYWRVDLTDTTVADHLETGRVFLGPSWVPSLDLLYGWSIASADKSRRTQSLGGQSHVDVLAAARVLEFTLSFMDEPEMFGNAFAQARAAGIHSDVLVIPQESSAYVSEQSVFGLVVASEPLVHERWRIFRMRYQVEERL
ncbi:MAG: hypothetical protein AB7P99_14245 [Vicinamibacterales bacterium]